MNKWTKIVRLAVITMLLAITLLTGCSGDDSAISTEAGAGAYSASNLYGAWDNDEMMISYLFREDGMVEISSYEQVTEAAYTLEPNGSLSLTAEGTTTEGAILDANRIEMNDISGFFYPVEYPWYIPQVFDVEGAWDNDAEEISFLFTDTGEVLITSYEEYITATYSYDPVQRTLIIYHDGEEYSGFVDDDDNIHMDTFEDIFYAVTYPWYTPDENDGAMSIEDYIKLGAWDNDEAAASIVFYDDGVVELSDYYDLYEGFYNYNDAEGLAMQFGDTTLFGTIDADGMLNIAEFEGSFYMVDYPWYIPEENSGDTGSNIVAGMGTIEPFMDEVINFASNINFDGTSTAGMYEYGYMYPQDAALDFYNRATGVVSSIADRSQYGILMVLGMKTEHFNDFINNEGEAARILYAEILSHFALFDFVQTVELNIIHSEASGSMGTDDYYFTREWANTVAGGNIADFGHNAQGIADIFAATISLNGANSVSINTPTAQGSDTPLTQAELNAYAQQFSLLNADRTATNIVTNFFTSYYNQPSEMDISAFVYYLPDPNSTSFESGQDAEYNLLREHHHFYADNSYALDEALAYGINYRRVSQSFVQSVLWEYMNVSVDIFDSANDALYLPEYQNYYNNPTDMGLDGFTPNDGYRKEDGTVVLYNDYTILTLVLIDGMEYIYSYQQQSSN